METGGVYAASNFRKAEWTPPDGIPTPERGNEFQRIRRKPESPDTDGATRRKYARLRRGYWEIPAFAGMVRRGSGNEFLFFSPAANSRRIRQKPPPTAKPRKLPPNLYRHK